MASNSLFHRPPTALVTNPGFHDDADIVHVPQDIWNTLLLPEDAKATLSISTSTKNQGSSTGLSSIVCKGVLIRDVGTI